MKEKLLSNLGAFTWNLRHFSQLAKICNNRHIRKIQLFSFFSLHKTVTSIISCTLKVGPQVIKTKRTNINFWLIHFGGGENLGDWRTKLSTLWLMNTFSIMSLLLLNLFESGDLTHIVPPLAVDDWSLLLVTVGIVVNLAMAFLSQSLADKVNRWLNVVVGAVFSVIALVALVLSLMENPSVVLINVAFGFVWTVLVVWIAWKSKKEA